MSDVAPTAADERAPSVVVFDIGEVLIDETRVWSIWGEILGVSPFSMMATLGAAIVQGEEYQAAHEHVAPNMDASTLEVEHERRYGGFTDADLYPDVRACLTDLRALGLRVALAGNQPQRRTEQLRALDLDVDHIATSDDLGADKPSPEFFEAVLALVGAAADQVLYVGDRVDNDVVPAMEAGMRTCWLQRGPWGLLQELPEDVQPDLVLTGLGELPTLIETWRAGGDDGETTGTRAGAV